MELHQLRYFLTVLDEGSFSAAAARHRVTQQAVSKSISRLEQELGARLFLRDGNSLTLTPAGQLVAGHAQVMDAESRQLDRHLGELLGNAPPHLRVGAGPTAARHLVAETVQRLLRENPNIHVAVSSGTTHSMAPQLKRGELDAFVSVLVQRKPDPQLRCDVLYHEPSLLVARACHPLVRRRRVSLAETLQYPWLGGSGMDHWGDLVRSSFVGAGLKPPQPRVKTDSLPFAYGLLACTDYLAVMPAALVEVDVDSGRLASINVPVDWSRPVALFYRDTPSRSVTVSAFISALRSVAARSGAVSRSSSAR